MIRTPGMWEAAEKRMAGISPPALRTVQRIRRSGGGPALLQPPVDAWGAPVPEPVGKRRR